MIRRIDAQNHRAGQDVQECLAALLALELLKPGRALYLCAPEVVDCPILPNELLQFAALLPHLPSTQIGLGSILQTLAERGVAICLIVPSVSRHAPRVIPPNWWWADVRQGELLYPRGLVTDQACLRGDLRFTHAGVTAWEGTLELLTEEDSVLAHKAVQNRWEELA
jgi:hypothetical protein